METDHHDAVANANALDIRADFDDLAQSIVAHGHRQSGSVFTSGLYCTASSACAGRRD